MQPGETPGHGVEIDERLAEKYPYDPAYLPVARLAVELVSRSVIPDGPKV
jgi:hypothetical protein